MKWLQGLLLGLCACSGKPDSEWQSMGTAPKDGTIIEVRLTGPYGWVKLERWATIDVSGEIEAIIRAYGMTDVQMEGSSISSGWHDVLNPSTGEIDRNSGIIDMPDMSWRPYGLRT